MNIPIGEADDAASKLELVDRHLDAELISFGAFYQIQAPEKGISLDFIRSVLGVKSLADLMRRSTKVSFGGCYSLNIASLEDIIRSKKLAGQDKDLAVLPVLERTLKVRNEKEKNRTLKLCRR